MTYRQEQRHINFKIISCSVCAKVLLLHILIPLYIFFFWGVSNTKKMHYFTF